MKGFILLHFVFLVIYKPAKPDGLVLSRLNHSKLFKKIENDVKAVKIITIGIDY